MHYTTKMKSTEKLLVDEREFSIFQHGGLYDSMYNNIPSMDTHSFKVKVLLSANRVGVSLFLFYLSYCKCIDSHRWFSTRILNSCKIT